MKVESQCVKCAQHKCISPRMLWLQTQMNCDQKIFRNSNVCKNSVNKTSRSFSSTYCATKQGSLLVCKTCRLQNIKLSILWGPCKTLTLTNIYTFFFPQESSSTCGWFWKVFWVVCLWTLIDKTATLKKYFLHELPCFKIKSARKTMCLLNQRLK